MNTWALLETAHYFWLVFQTWPLVVYLEGPSLYGAGIPFGVSLLVLLWVFAPKVLSIYNKIPRKSSHSFLVKLAKYSPDTTDFPLKLIIGFFLANVAIGHYSGYLGNTGYHFLDTSVIFWPVLILLDKRIPVLMVYPLTFIGMLADDVYAAGQFAHWGTNYWFGVGGAGFHDGLFIGPMTTLVLSLCMLGLRLLLARIGFSIDQPVNTVPELSKSV